MPDNLIIKKRNNNQIDAIDAIIKIKYLLAAAQYLTASADEDKCRYELLSLIEDLVTRTLDENGE